MIARYIIAADLRVPGSERRCIIQPVAQTPIKALWHPKI